MSEKTVFSPGSFFHGTKADLQTGDFIITGKKKNYNDERKSDQILPFKTAAENRGGSNPMGRAFSGSIRQYAGKS